MNLVSFNELQKLWFILQMVWQLRIHCFFNKLNIGSFILNILCVENPYKRMGMWATSISRFNAYSMKNRFAQWNLKYDLFEK